MYWLFIVLQFMATSLLHGQSVEDSLKQHSNDWMKALERKDSALLNSYLANEFILGGAGEADNVDRATWLKNALGRNWTQTKYHFMEVKVQGNTALVNSRMSFKVNPVPFNITSNIIDHWVYRDGRWQVVSRYIGGDSINNGINAAKGFLAGVVVTLLIAWM